MALVQRTNRYAWSPLSFLSKLFSRKSVTHDRPGGNADAAALQAQIGKTINDALAAAGLSGLPAPQRRERTDRLVDKSSLTTARDPRGACIVHSAGKRLYKLYVPAQHAWMRRCPWC